jgi:nitrous oxidase accessory protein NosD
MPCFLSGLRAPIGLATFLLCLGFAGMASAKTLEVGQDKPFKQPSEAAAKAAEGDVIRIAPGEYFDCAIWRANDLVIEGTGAKPDDTVITDKTCQGKGLFITAGTGITVRNLTLTRARVPDSNGAGIRMQAPNLTVERVRFVNNQDGILTNDVGGSLTVRDSAFVRNGICAPACAHGIYAGKLDLLHVERSQFLETRQAHHVKSRAKRTEVIDSELRDGPEGTSSYAIEAPNGGAVLVRGCTIEKGPKAENHVGAIVIGMEGVTQRTPEIVVENNSFRVDGDYSSFLVVNQTATEAVLKGNKLAGNAKALRGDGEVH